MANKYNIHSQAAQEDVTDQRLETLRHIQKQQPSHFSPAVQYATPMLNGSGNYYQRTSTNYSNIQGLRLKSKLNPMAQEFYPSYMRNPKNGYTHSLNNVMRASAPEYEFGVWPTYEYDNRYLPSGRYFQGQIQRSNTVLPLVRNDCSGSGSTADGSLSTSFQEPTSIEQLNKNGEINRGGGGGKHDGNAEFLGEENIKTNENVWFIDKRIETNKENHNQLWTYQEETEETSSKDEYYEAQIECEINVTNPDPINEQSIDFTQEDEYKSQGEGMEVIGENFHENNITLQKTDFGRKKLIMLYPVKKQQEEQVEGSQESIFEQPNPIAYTSDESFLAQSNSNSGYNDDVDKIIKEGKQFYSKNVKPLNNIIDEMQDLSEDFERTTKQSDLKSYESSESDSSKSIIEQKLEKTTSRYKNTARQIEIRVLRKYDAEKKSTTSPIRKWHRVDLAEKDNISQKLPLGGKDAKSSVQRTKKFTPSFTNSKEGSRASSKLTRGGFIEETKALSKLPRVGLTGSKLLTGAPAAKVSETASKAVGKSSITGAIPKTKETFLKTAKRPMQIPEESSPKSIRNLPPKGNTIKKEETKSDTKSHRLPNGFIAPRTQTTPYSRKNDAITNNNHTEVKSTGKPELLQKKQVFKPTARSRSIERKVIASRNSEVLTQDSKQTSLNSSAHTNNLSKRITNTTTFRDRLTPKFVIKTQMRSATNIHNMSPPKKSNTPHSVLKRDNDSKKPKTISESRNIQAKSTKAVTSTKIPIRQKSNSLRGVKAVIGSDGDNIKVKTSKSCISLRGSARKNITKKTSVTSTKIGDKLPANRKIISRELGNSTLRQSQLERRRSIHQEGSIAHNPLPHNFLPK